MKKLYIGCLSLLAIQGAFGAQISLTTANVIGGTVTYSGTFDAGSYNARRILDQQTGSVTDVAGTNYWLNPDNGTANANIVVDLGEEFRIGSFEIFNTHNANHNDRGTGQFRILGGNAVTLDGANGYQISGTTAVLASGTLTAVNSANDPIEGETFSSSSNNLYRYLVFEPLSVSSSAAPCCGANVYGLNELRVFDAPNLEGVPEPSTFSLVGGIGLVAGWFVRRRKSAN